MSGLVREVPEPSKHQVMGWALAAGPGEAGPPHSPWMLAEQAAARGCSPSKGVRLGVAGEEETGRLLASALSLGLCTPPQPALKPRLLDILVGQALGPGQVASRPHPNGIHVAEPGQACLWPFIHFSVGSFSVGSFTPATEPTLPLLACGSASTPSLAPLTASGALSGKRATFPVQVKPGAGTKVCVRVCHRANSSCLSGRLPDFDSCNLENKTYFHAVLPHLLKRNVLN